MAYFSTFFDADPNQVTNIIRQGDYNLSNCGGSSQWVIGDKPSEDTEGLIFTAPYLVKDMFILLIFF